MKQLKSLISLLLLCSLAFLIVHDFSFEQLNNKKIFASEYSKVVVPNIQDIAVLEHHIFHTPFLLDDTNVFSDKTPKDKNYFSLVSLKPIKAETHLYTPPKA